MSAAAAEVIWHDVECGGYGADLALWDELAATAGGPLLDLGCGTGRVALHLARRGHEVTGVDVEPELVAELRRRAEGLPATAIEGDARDLDLGVEFGLAIAPMQLVQLLAGESERLSCLRRLADHLGPGGVAALAIVEAVEVEDERSPSPSRGWMRRPAEPPLPDTREVDGVVYSSLPLPTELDGDALLVRRLRQTVSPDGLLGEEASTIRLRLLDADRLEREARAAGFEPLPRRSVPPTEDHVGSTVVLLRKAGA